MDNVYNMFLYYAKADVDDYSGLNFNEFNERGTVQYLLSYLILFKEILMQILKLTALVCKVAQMNIILMNTLPLDII